MAKKKASPNGQVITNLDEDYFNKRFFELPSTLASKNDIAELKAIIHKQQEKIDQLESKVAIL